MDNDIYMCVDACSVEWVCCVVMEMCVCVETSYCSESLWSITVYLVLGLCYLTGMHLLLHCKKQFICRLKDLQLLQKIQEIMQSEM